MCPTYGGLYLGTSNSQNLEQNHIFCESISILPYRARRGLQFDMLRKGLRAQHDTTLSAHRSDWWFLGRTCDSHLHSHYCFSLLALQLYASELVVLGRESLDTLQARTENIFSDIPNRSFARKQWGMPLYSKDQLLMQTPVKSVLQQQSLELQFMHQFSEQRVFREGSEDMQPKRNVSTKAIVGLRRENETPNSYTRAISLAPGFAFSFIIATRRRVHPSYRS